jgi:sRNA-binding protein
MRYQGLQEAEERAAAAAAALLEAEEREAAAKAARKRKKKKKGKQQGAVPPPEQAPASPLEEPSETPDDTQVSFALSISTSCNGRVQEVECGECCHEDIRNSCIYYLR